MKLASLFADGFEGATFPSPWQSRTQQNSGTATRDATAAMTGSFGLKAQVTSNTGNTTSSRAYVTTPTTAPVATYHVKFQVNASGMSNMANTRWLTIYQARGGATERFRVELQKDASGARVRLVVSANNGNAAANTTTPITAGPRSHRPGRLDLGGIGNGDPQGRGHHGHADRPQHQRADRHERAPGHDPGTGG